MQFDIVLTRHQNNGYTARPVLWPEVVARGDNEDDALENVRALIAELQLQASSKIVQVDVAEPEQQIQNGTYENHHDDRPTQAEKSQKMAQEQKAYEQMLPELREKYLGQFVAIFQGELIDHDPDELTLFGRIDKRFPDDVVLMTEVLAGPRPIIHMRSPRLLSNP